MGDHQSDPADEAAQTNGGSAEERRSSNEDQTVKTDIDPKAFGSSSSRVRRLMRQRRRKMMTSPADMGIRLHKKERVSVFVRLPMSQKVIC